MIILYPSLFRLFKVSIKEFEFVYPACGSHNSAIKLTIPQLEETSNYKKWIDSNQVVLFGRRRLNNECTSVIHSHSFLPLKPYRIPFVRNPQKENILLIIQISFSHIKFNYNSKHTQIFYPLFLYHNLYQIFLQIISKN